MIALTTAEGWNGRFDPFFCKMYFLYVSWGHKTFLTGFWGVLPCQKGPKFQASTLNELVCQNWGAPLNFGKLLSTSTDTFQAYSPQWSGLLKLRGAPQFWQTALQCISTDVASTTSTNDCYQILLKLHDIQLPVFFLNLVANQNTCSVSEEYTVDIHTVELYLSMSMKWLPGLYPEAAVPTLLPRRRLLR